MNLRNFQLNSDYPIDKIVLLKEIAIPDTTSFQVNFAHGLGAVPYCKAMLTNDNWNTSYPSGVQRSGQQVVEQSFRVVSNETTVSIIGWLSSGGPGIARVWGVFNEDTTKDIDVPPTRDLSSNAFILNTKFNYQRLFMQGEISTAGGDVTIAHNLGFVPVLDVWLYNGSTWTDMLNTESFVNSSLYGQSVVVSKNSLTFRKDNSESQRFYYRLYAHEAI